MSFKFVVNMRDCFHPLTDQKGGGEALKENVKPHFRAKTSETAFCFALLG